MDHARAHHDDDELDELVPRFDEADDDDPSTETVVRADASCVLAPPTKRADGSLVYEGVLARAGTLTYTRNGRPWTELVTEDVLRADAASLVGGAVTVGHPREGGRLVLVNPDNRDRYGVGHVERSYVENGEHRVTLVVSTRRGLDAVQRGGRRELSAGYRARIQRRPGTDPEHGAYDALQVRRFNNHAAIAHKGRAGGTVLRADSLDADLPTDNDTQEVRMHPKIAVLAALLGVELRADAKDDDALELIERALRDQDQTRADSASELEATKAKLAAEEAAHQKTKKTLDELRADSVKAAEEAQLAELKPVLEHYEIKADSVDTVAAANAAIAKAYLGDAYADKGAVYDEALATAAAKAMADAATASRWRRANPVRGDEGDDARSDSKAGDKRPRKSLSTAAKSHYQRGEA